MDLGCPRELACGVPDRFFVDLSLVSLLDHAEIGSPGFPILAALPAMTGEEIRSRCEYVRRAVQEIAAAVGVEIDGIFEIGRRHELRLADLPGPGAAHFGRREIAALDDAERIHQFGA